MDNVLGAIILGIAQGITEWLPISSSGHLVIFEEFFGLKADVFFNLMLHFATLLVVCFVFRSELLDMLKTVARLDFKNENGRLFLFIMTGSIPIALAGFFFESLVVSLFSNLFVVGISLLLTGCILYLSKLSHKIKTKAGLGYKNSFIIGVFQALALVPGISRSGATISSALLAGIERKKAIRFSFLLSIPAVAGATMFMLSKTTMASFQPSLFFGMLASMIVGYISLKIIIKIILDRKFYLFSFYCWVLGVIIIYLALIG